MTASAPMPIRCYWELTRRCHGACVFCRNDDAADTAELSLTESLGVADALVDLGIRRVVLTGGEPVRYPGWEQIARRLVNAGMEVWLFTSGIGITRETVDTVRTAGISRILISLDGDKATHNRLRPPAGKRQSCSYTAAVTAIEEFTAQNIPVIAVTEVNHGNAPVLEDIYAQLLQLGVHDWQVHLCQMTGRARAHRDELTCTHGDMECIIRVLGQAAREHRIHAPLHCTVGYMTREEAVLRNPISTGQPFFNGCNGGIRTFGITPSGDVKACTALGDEFAVASLTQRPLREILTDDRLFAFTRMPESHRPLEGECGACAFGNVCHGGCPAVAYGLTGAIGANPSCLHRMRRMSENR